MPPKIEKPKPTPFDRVVKTVQGIVVALLSSVAIYLLVHRVWIK